MVLQRERERASAAIGLGFTLCLANFKCIRPLLNVKKNEIRKYLKESDQAWCEDSSNRDVKLRRNFWRAKIERNAEFEAQLLRIVEGTRFLLDNEEGLLALEASVLKEAEQIHWSAGVDCKISEDWDAQLLRHVSHLGHRWPNLKGVDCERLMNLLTQKEEVEVAKNRWLSLSRKVLSLRDNAIQRSSISTCLNGYGRCVLEMPPRYYLLELVPEGVETPEVLYNSAVFSTLVDLNGLRYPLDFRFRRSGDCFSPRKLRSTKRSLLKFYSENKWSRLARNEWPVVAFENQVVWIPGHETSDFFKADETSSRRAILRMVCQIRI